MDLIIETDIGHDPDDLFAICYLAAAGVNIRAILISPGDPDQIAIAKFVCDEIGLNIPIGVSHENRDKLSSGSIHHELLKKYGRPLEAKADGMGVDIITSVLGEYPDCQLFVIGPVTSIGRYLKNNPEAYFDAATMQGGFLPYSVCDANVRHPNFEGKDSMPTFNLNGDRESGVRFIAANIACRQMVGKNVCHTIMFDREQGKKICPKPGPGCRASSLFKEAADMYLEKHEGKKFHDPTAACLHLHSEIGTWLHGKTVKSGSGWTTVADSKNGDKILVDVDRDMLWGHLLNFK